MPKKGDSIPDANSDSLTFQISLIVFKEDDGFFIYSPAFHMYGFHKNKKEAIKSFEKNLDVFLEYTSRNRILVESLLAIGWQKRGTVKNPKMLMPSLDMLLEIDSELRKIHFKIAYQIKIKEIQLPLSLFMK